MRAVVHDRYGPPEVLRIGDVARPVPGDEEILVRVRATTVNRTDCGWRSGSPFFVRYFTGVRRPKWRTLGMEFAGEVEAVGSMVTEFAVGDRVFGVQGHGANAEFVSVRAAGAVTHMPAGMSFEEAAAICDGACIALSCLRNADLREGRSVVVYGASGSVGTAAVQLARHSGAHVTAVCNTKTVELVRSLGADEVVDYEREDFTKNGKTYDVIFDAVGKHSYRRCRRSLAPDGMYIETDLGFMWHVPLLALTRQARDARRGEVQEGGRRFPEGARGGGRVPRGHRPHVSARGRGRRDAVRRDRAEDGQRRADRGCAVRAVVHDRYGPPEVLRVDEVERPSPKDDEVLVRVHATTVTRTDIHMRRARPILWRFMLGFLRPRRRILGLEFAGVVEEVGAGGHGVRGGGKGLRPPEQARTRNTCACASTGSSPASPTASRSSEACVCDGMSQGLGALRTGQVGPRDEAPRVRRVRLARDGGRPARERSSALTSRPCATRRTSSSSARSAPTR